MIVSFDSIKGVNQTMPLDCRDTRTYDYKSLPALVVAELSLIFASVR